MTRVFPTALREVIYSADSELTGGVVKLVSVYPLGQILASSLPRITQLCITAFFSDGEGEFNPRLTIFYLSGIQGGIFTTDTFTKKASVAASV